MIQGSNSNTKLVDIEWEALEAAVERNSSNCESYLDLSTGAILTVVQGEPEAAVIREKISSEIKNFTRIEAVSSREQYKWMENFVGSVIDATLRERLQIAIDGKGAFRRFKDVLLAFPVERERWFNHRASLLHWNIQQWLGKNNITSESNPPWGDIDPPVELPVLNSNETLAKEAPGESLRREAREMIDMIAAIDLPTALAFLEFLKEKSSKELGIESLKKHSENRKVSNG